MEEEQKRQVAGYYSQASRLFEDYKLDKAISIFHDILKILGTVKQIPLDHLSMVINVYSKLGIAYAMKRKFPHAVRSLTKAVELGKAKNVEPEIMSDIMMHLGKCQIASGKRDKGIEYLKKSALFGNKQSMQILRSIGVTHLILDNPEEL